MLGERNRLGSDTQRAAAEAIVAPVLAACERQPASGLVAAYVAYGGELSLAPTVIALVDAGFEIVLPVSRPDAHLDFCSWAPGEPLVRGPYGIGEPTTSPVDPKEIMTVLVPGVGFARDGSRIGHGVGYYDRFFARCFSANHDPRRIGIAHDLQMVDLPEAKPWDVAMHEVITPSEVFHVPS